MTKLTDAAFCSKLRSKTDLLEAAGLDVSLFREAETRLLACSMENFALAVNVGNIRKDYNDIVNLLIGDDFEFFDFEGWLRALDKRLIEEGRSANHAEILLSTLRMTDKRIVELTTKVSDLESSREDLQCAVQRYEE